MRRLLGSLAIWSVVVVAIVLFWPGQVETPGCASHVTPTAECLRTVERMNIVNWWSEAVPLLVVAAAGYLAILGLAWRSRRQLRG